MLVFASHVGPKEFSIRYITRLVATFVYAHQLVAHFAVHCVASVPMTVAAARTITFKKTLGKWDALWLASNSAARVQGERAKGRKGWGGNRFWSWHVHVHVHDR